MKIIVLIQNSCRWAFYALMLSCFQIKMSGKFFDGDTDFGGGGVSVGG